MFLPNMHHFVTLQPLQISVSFMSCVCYNNGPVCRPHWGPAGAGHAGGCGDAGAAPTPASGAKTASFNKQQKSSGQGACIMKCSAQGTGARVMKSTPDDAKKRRSREGGAAMHRRDATGCFAGCARDCGVCSLLGCFVRGLRDAAPGGKNVEDGGSSVGGGGGGGDQQRMGAGQCGWGESYAPIASAPKERGGSTAVDGQGGAATHGRSAPAARGWKTCRRRDASGGRSAAEGQQGEKRVLNRQGVAKVEGVGCEEGSGGTEVGGGGRG